MVILMDNFQYGGLCPPFEFTAEPFISKIVK